MSVVFPGATVPTNAEFIALKNQVTQLITQNTTQDNRLSSAESRLTLLEGRVTALESVPPPVVIPPPVITPPGFHEPAGLTLLDNTDWTNGVGLWWRNFETADKPFTTITVLDGPNGVPTPILQIGYLMGHVGGGGTELGRWLSTKVSELYWRYPVRVNPTWQGHTSGINKMVYLHDGDTNFSAMWYEMFGMGQGPLDLYVVNQTGQDIGYHGPASFTRGVWHTVEIYQKQGQPGHVTVWVDNVLVLDTAVITRASPIGLIVISGIWGGIGDSKQHNDYMQFGPLYVSGR